MQALFWALVGLYMRLHVILEVDFEENVIKIFSSPKKKCISKMKATSFSQAPLGTKKSTTSVRE